MAPEDRPLPASVKTLGPLLDEGHRYAFFQAMRLLRLQLGEAAFEQGIRVRPALSMSFPENDIEAIRHEDGLLRITANFFGLYGVTSPLPTFYTEDLIDEYLGGGSNSRDFLDILHAVLYPMLFKAWEKNRIWLAVTEQQDAERLNQLMALLGLHGNCPDTPVFGLRGLLPHAGNFNQYPRSALGLQAMVSGMLDCAPVWVESCVSRLVSIPLSARTRLGDQSCQLGVDSMLGSQVGECAGQADIHVGPLSATQFERLLPDGGLFPSVSQAVAHYVDAPIQCVLGLRVEPAQRERVGLGAGWNRLGLNTWLPETDPGAADSPGRVCDEVFLPIDLEATRQNLRIPS